MHQHIFKPENMRRKLKALRMRVHELLSTTGVDGAAISRIEHGERNPGIAILSRLAGALKVSPDYFFDKVSMPVQKRPTHEPARIRFNPFTIPPPFRPTISHPFMTASPGEV